MSKIIIAGGSGLIGRNLLSILNNTGMQTHILSRFPSDKSDYYWNPAKNELDDRAMDGTEVIINLSGAGIAEKRWTASRKEKLINSRIQSTRLLVNSINSTDNMIHTFINASAVGFYGNSDEKLFTEQDKAGEGFLASLCNDWEAEADKIENEGIRIIKPRIGVVLSNKGGALPKLMMSLNFGLINYFGNGSQHMPWIHEDDLGRMFLHFITNPDVNGVYNAVSPQLLTNKELVQSIVAVNGPGLILPIPEFVLKMIFGKMSSTILDSQRCSAEKVLSTGFKFNFPDIKSALLDLKKKKLT